MQEYQFRAIMLCFSGIVMISIGLLMNTYNITTITSWFNLQLNEPTDVGILEYIAYGFGSIGIVLGVLTFYVKDDEQQK